MEDILFTPTPNLDDDISIVKSRVEAQFAGKVKNIYNGMVQDYNSLMRMFWNHRKLTPQQVSDALGTKATSVFQYGSKLKDLILDVTPDADLVPVPDTVELVFNLDGTVTINSI